LGPPNPERVRPNSKSLDCYDNLRSLLTETIRDDEDETLRDDEDETIRDNDT